MNIDGFSEKTAGLLYDVFGVCNFSDLYVLDREKVRLLDGYKDAKTDNLFNAIEKSKNVQLSNFIYALSIDNVGKKTAKDLAVRYSNFNNIKNAQFSELIEMQDVGEIVAKSIYEFFNDKENLLEISRLFESGITVLENKNVAKGAFFGEKVVLTGSLTQFKRDEASEIIEKLGGEILSSVSKKTTIVLAGENAGSKLDKAKALRIKIIDEEMFKSLIKS